MLLCEVLHHELQSLIWTCVLLHVAAPWEDATTQGDAAQPRLQVGCGCSVLQRCREALRSLAAAQTMRCPLERGGAGALEWLPLPALGVDWEREGQVWQACSWARRSCTLGLARLACLPIIIERQEAE